MKSVRGLHEKVIKNSPHQGELLTAELGFDAL